MTDSSVSTDVRSLDSITTEVTDVACTQCGCVCDDLRVRVDGGRVIAVDRACGLAEPWFLDSALSTDRAPLIEGHRVSLPKALEQAGEILAKSHSPLIYGLSCSSTPGQRAAVRLADRIGATIDTTASTCHAPSIMAWQAVGESTSSLGEVRQRADLVVYWGSNPIKSHPRHIERVVDSHGMFTPLGREDRHLIVVDTRSTLTTELADTFIQVEPGGDFELIWALRACLRDQPLGMDSIGGVSRRTIIEFAKRLMSARYGAIFFGLGLTRHGVPHQNVEALLHLTTDLHEYTRCVVRRMRVPGDVAGADSVLCWQTGFPFSVNLASGYPRYNPGEFTAGDMLERGEVDAVLLVGSEGVDKLSTAAQRQLNTVPTIVLDSPTDACPFSPTVHITTGTYGVHYPGTAYRMDEIPIPLRAFLDTSLPSDETVLNAITEACCC